MQRRRLLLAITEVVGEGGIEAASVGRVCEQAGVSRRTFYELFEDREDCLRAACEAHVRRLGELLGDAFGRPGRWVDRVRDALCVTLEHFDAEPGLARLCVIESARAGSPVLELRRRTLEVLAGEIDRGRADARAGAEPPPLTGQGVVGGALSVVHGRLLDGERGDGRAAGAKLPLSELSGELMAMIAHPYLGAAAARRELERPSPSPSVPAHHGEADPFKGLPIRFTYRTARVLATIADSPGTSNRHIGRASGIADDGQVSRLLARLRDCALIENSGGGHGRGEANAWSLTPRGRTIHEAIEMRG